MRSRNKKVKCIKYDPQIKQPTDGRINGRSGVESLSTRLKNIFCSQSFESILLISGEDIVFLATDINLPGAVDWVMMQSCFGHHFMLVLEKQEKIDGHQQFFAIVQLIGTRKQAENFAYRCVGKGLIYVRKLYLSHNDVTYVGSRLFGTENGGTKFLKFILQDRRGRLGRSINKKTKENKK